MAPVPQPEPIAESFEALEQDYPPASLLRGETGLSRIAVRVEPDGTASECAVLDSSGYRDLDVRACQIALCRWRFNPATVAGKPVAAVTIRNYRWSISGDDETRGQATAPTEMPSATAPAGPGPVFRIPEGRRAIACAGPGDLPRR